MVSIFLLGLASGLVYADKDMAPPAPTAPVAPDAPEAPTPPKRAFVGVVTEKVSSATAVQLGLNPGVGLTVESVVKDSAAEIGGLEKYDILLEMDGQWLTSVSHLTTLLSLKSPGDEVTFKLLRKGSELSKKITLGEKAVKGKSLDWEWEFEGRMEEFGRKMEEFAEREEIMKHVREHVNPDEIEESVRSALDKARYHINQWVSDDGKHTSIVHTGNARSIISVDEGTLIVEGLDDGASKVIAINSEDEVLFSGVVGKDGKELEALDPWVKEQYGKLAQKRVKVIISDDVDIETEVSTTITSDDAG